MQTLRLNVGTTLTIAVIAETATAQQKRFGAAVADVTARTLPTTGTTPRQANATALALAFVFL